MRACIHTVHTRAFVKFLMQSRDNCILSFLTSCSIFAFTSLPLCPLLQLSTLKTLGVHQHSHVWHFKHIWKRITCSWPLFLVMKESQLQCIHSMLKSWRRIFFPLKAITSSPAPLFLAHFIPPYIYEQIFTFLYTDKQKPAPLSSSTVSQISDLLCTCQRLVKSKGAAAFRDLN